MTKADTPSRIAADGRARNPASFPGRRACSPIDEPSRADHEDHDPEEHQECAAAEYADVELPPRTRFDAPTQSDRHPVRCEPGAGDAEQEAGRHGGHDSKQSPDRLLHAREAEGAEQPPFTAGRGCLADDRLTDRDGGCQRGNEAEQDEPDGEDPDRVFDRTHVLALEAGFGAVRQRGFDRSTERIDTGGIVQPGRKHELGGASSAPYRS